MSSPFLEQVNRTPVTYVVLLAYLTLALVTGVVTPDMKKLLELGAAVGDLVRQGEVWRLVTYAFLHGGPIHLAFNSYFLFVLGPPLEQALRSPRFALIYLVSAVGGAIGGSLWHEPFTPLVGGSGALFGLMGAAVALNMRQGRHLLDFLNYVGPRQLLMLIAANLVLGALIPMVSNAGHIGGLVAGFVLTFCFLERGRDPVDRVSRAIQAGWIALFASLLFYCVRPVVRWDYLLARFQQAEMLEEKAAFARAVVLRAPDLATLAMYVRSQDGMTDDERRRLLNDLLLYGRGG